MDLFFFITLSVNVNKWRFSLIGSFTYVLYTWWQIEKIDAGCNVYLQKISKRLKLMKGALKFQTTIQLNIDVENDLLIWIYSVLRAYKIYVKVKYRRAITWKVVQRYFHFLQ